MHVLPKTLTLTGQLYFTMFFNWLSALLAWNLPALLMKRVSCWKTKVMNLAFCNWCHTIVHEHYRRSLKKTAKTNCLLGEEGLGGMKFLELRTKTICWEWGCGGWVWGWNLKNFELKQSVEWGRGEDLSKSEQKQSRTQCWRFFSLWKQFSSLYYLCFLVSLAKRITWK